ncbi:RNA polymerase sigma-70 factor (ECF subfamily) [Ulvibacter sp. MAR_2010_11]|uniref:RNA polymerase sigma factor n=1 Tax=Ulvibacter sp. MAR_2010_11 TaxID=1250229 RepID=UPI000C2C70AD|nr:sigma-70 family RNA polymerase sigma factor [Ulvibacter sp. MAR_2010_11]PKA82163.1 RNA polymerase sigma-70 factor (ECF subfamily) [Ulvibacter sp. MAR_2010_11]
MSDTLLVEQCKQNNRKAQMALYKRYCDGMFIIAQRYVKDTAAAEDAMQEAFVKAFQKLHQFKGDVTFGSWLKRIVINTCLDVIKARKMELYSINEEVMHISEEGTDWEVSDETTYSEILNAIEKLPENYKTVVQLFLLEGYDHQEISQVLDISESASRTNLHRGKIQLQEQLKHLQYGTGY